MADSVQIDLIVEAISKGFDKIEKDLKSVGDSSKKAGDEAKKGNEGFKAFGDSMKQLGTIAAGAAVIISGALVAGLAKTVMAASDAEESMSKFNVVFKDLSGGPEALAVEIDKLSEATGRSKYELIGAVGALGDLFQPLGFSTDAAADLSLQMTSLAIDLSSFNNMPMDEALQRLQGTLIGSHENALAFGVVINENTLKAEMMANGTDKLTGAQFEQAKVQARLNLLMAGTTAAQGDAIRTSDGFANQMKALQGSMQDLAVEIGQKFLPAAIEAIGKIREMADDAIPTLIAAAEKAGPALLKMVEGGIKQITLAASTANLNNLYSQLKDLGVESGELSDILGDSRAQFDLWRTDADMADDLARNEAGVRKLNYAIIGMNLGLSDTPRIVGTVANGFQDSTSELEDFVTAMEAMNLGLPVAATGMEYWNLATRRLTPAIEDITDATQQATVDTSLLALDVIHATNAVEEMTLADIDLVAAQERINALWGESGTALQPLFDAYAQAAAATGEMIRVDGQWVSDHDIAKQAIETANAAIATSYKTMAADAILAEQGINQTTLDLMVTMGLLTQQEADQRMEFVNNSDIINTVLIPAYESGRLSAEELNTAIDLLADGTVNSGESAMVMAEAMNNNTTPALRDAKLEAGLLGDELEILGGMSVEPGFTAPDLSGAISRAERLKQLLSDLDNQGSAGGYGGNQNLDGGVGGGANGGGAGGASSGGGGGGYVGPGAASGIDFVVPPGFPNDSYLQPVQSGERVQVTPAGQSSTSGMTVNNNFNGPVNPGQVMREMAIVQAMMGA